jgi:rhodanese-related sulfurtransferase
VSASSEGPNSFSIMTPFSLVLEHPPASPEEAQRHFLARLAVETDPFDVRADLDRGVPIVLIDPRPNDAYRRCHVEGAISLPYRTISRETTAALPEHAALVTYGWGPACNAGTKAAERLSALGFRVKEMIGGLEYWRHEGHPIAGTLRERAPLYG